MGSCSSNDEPEIPVNPENPTESEAAGTMVIYEANPRFFATDNCLNAINARLDEIKELGTTVLWIMPVCEPGELKSVGSPYCIKDYKAVNQRYGTGADLKSLVDNAHSKGMDVILDWVANHTSWDNKWITEHPDWYTGLDEWGGDAVEKRRAGRAFYFQSRDEAAAAGASVVAMDGKTYVQIVACDVPNHGGGTHGVRHHYGRR